MSDFNAMIREAAGRDVREPETVVRPVGDLGVGKGAAAAPRALRATSNEQVNSRLRRAFSLARHGVTPNVLTVDDPWDS